MASKRSHAQRVQSGVTRFLAAHPGASQTEAQAFARGHWRTPEHGYLKQSTGASSAVYEVYRAGDVKRMLGTVADEYGAAARITITVHDANGTHQFFRNPGREWGAGGGVTAAHARTVLWATTPDFARGIAQLLSGKAGSYSGEKIRLKFRKIQSIQIAVQVPAGGRLPHAA